MNIKSLFQLSVLVVLSGFIVSCSALKNNEKQDQYPVSYVNKYGVRGIIFPDTVSFWNKNIPDFLTGRFSPTQDDIFHFEKIFHDEYVNYQAKWKSTPSNRISPERYSRWVRHYYGFYNEGGEKIIWVVFIQLNRNSRKHWRRGPYFQLPGAWEILANLNTGSLMNFQ